MAITRMQMKRQLYANGGIMDVTPREKFGLGSKLKKFVRKIIPNEVADIATKAAPFVAPFNPALAGVMGGLGSFDQTGSISGALKSGALNYGGGQLARYAGGAGFQGNPFGTGGAFTQGGFQGGFSSPFGTQTGIGKMLNKPIEGVGVDSGRGGTSASALSRSTANVPGAEAINITPTNLNDYVGTAADIMPTNLNDYVGTAADIIPTNLNDYASMNKDTILQNNPGVFDSITNSIKNFDYKGLGEKTLELGKKFGKAAFTDKNGDIDKAAVLGAATFAASYAEALALANDAGVDLTEEEYDEAQRAEKKEEYAGYLTNFFGGKKDGGRIGFKDGANKTIEEKIAELESLTNKLMTEQGIQDRGYASQLASDIINMKNESIDPDRLKFLNNESALFALPRDMRPEDEYYDTLKALENRANGGRIGFESGANEMIKTQLLEEIMPDTSTEDMIMIMTEAGPKMIKRSVYESMSGMFRDTTTGFGANINRIEEANGGRIGFKSGTIILGEDELAEMGGEQGLKLKLLAEKFMEEGMSESDAYEKAANSLYAKGGRVSRKFGSPKEGEKSGVMEMLAVDVDAGGDDEEDMLMAYTPGFSSQEKSYLFRRMGASGGAERSYTMPQLYRILKNPADYPEDAAVLKEIAVMGLGKKDGGRIGYKDGTGSSNRVAQLMLERDYLLSKDEDVSFIDLELERDFGIQMKSEGGIMDAKIPTGQMRKKQCWSS